MTKTEPAPDAPTCLDELPTYWDKRRELEGKPDTSRCAAELRVALRKRADALEQGEHKINVRLVASGPDGVVVEYDLFCMLDQGDDLGAALHQAADALKGRLEQQWSMHDTKRVIVGARPLQVCFKLQENTARRTSWSFDDVTPPDVVARLREGP